MHKPLIALGVLLGAAVGVFLLAAGGRPHADLVWTQGSSPSTLDPGRMTDVAGGRIAAALFEGLVYLDTRTLEPLPGVAERWEISPDRRTYTFHLRADARWSDGRPVTAADFIYAWRRVLDPDTHSQYVGLLFPIRGARAYYEAAAKDSGAGPDWSTVGVRAEGDRRLVVRLEHPTVHFLKLVAFSTYLPLRRDVVEDAEGNEREGWTRPPHLVSDGPYMLERWDFHRQLVWRKNPHYWNADEVALDRVVCRIYDDKNTALLAYETGEVQLSTTIPRMAIGRLLELRDAGRRDDVKVGPYLATYFYRLNTDRPALADPRVRRALAMAIDREEIVRRGSRGGEEPARALVPPMMAGYEGPRGMREDPEAARQLLAEAGYPGGKGLPEISILVNQGADHVPMAEVIQQQWASRLGVRSRIDQLEWKVFLDRVNQQDYDVARAGWIGDYQDPSTFLDMFVTDGGHNDTGWSSEQYDRLLREAAREPDPDRRAELFAEAETILLDAAPIIPIRGYVVTNLVHPDLVGVPLNLRNLIDFRRVRWREPNNN